MLPFRQEKQETFFDLQNRSCLVNTNDQFLTNNICCKMFLRRIDMPRLPKNTYSFKEREDDLDDHFFNTGCRDLLI
jgi:hypothetical protein